VNILNTMYKLRGELVNMRNIVDDTLYGCKQMAEVEKRKFNMGADNLGKAMATATRYKIYRDILDAIYALRNKKHAIRFILSAIKRTKIHVNQLKKLGESNWKDTGKTFGIFIEWLQLAQLRMLRLM